MVKSYVLRKVEYTYFGPLGVITLQYVQYFVLSYLNPSLGRAIALNGKQHSWSSLNKSLVK